MTKKVLLYLRNSADTLRTACADSQRHFAETFIRKNGWKLELTCRDEDIGEVAFTAQPGVHKLLNEIEFGSSDIVLCHTLDRLCSRLPDAARLLHDPTPACWNPSGRRGCNAVVRHGCLRANARREHCNVPLRR